jgi:glycosyltransferase involved in cell wall biosynthesis
MQENTVISICVPALNEESNINQAVEDLWGVLSRHFKGFEIIIVNDGSWDQTARLSKDLSIKHSQIKVINHAKNLGIGSCYRDALLIAQGNYFTWFPADGEGSTEEVLRCLPHLSEKVIVISNHLESDKRTRFRRAVSRLYTFMLNKYFNLNLKYFNGLTIISTQAARKIPLVTNGFFCNAEIIIRAIKSGYRIIELSAPLGRRLSGESKALSFGSLLRAGQDLVRIFRSNI